MKCLILAAGYATRLYPLTENFPKPLLEVAGKPILDWLMDDLDRTGMIDGYVVVTNHRFAPIFREWASRRMEDTTSGACGRPWPHEWEGPAPSGVGGMERSGRLPEVVSSIRQPITIIDDGTSTNETRLGAVRDIQLGIREGRIEEDLLVMAGDNLLTFSLQGFLDYFREKGTSCVMRFWQPDLEKLHKSGVAEVDAEGLILSMEEKPAEPKAHWCCPPFYMYRKEDLPLVDVGIAEGCGVDAPGSFIAWLCGRTSVHAWEMPGERLDIGNLESYHEAIARFKNLS